jgi:exosortase/archaeosortase family protein
MAYVLATRRPWWEKAVLLASSAPIALIANSLRIVATGLLYQYASDDAAIKFNHDLAGWLMIPFAALLFASLLWYLGQLMREIEPVHVGQIVRR